MKSLVPSFVKYLSSVTHSACRQCSYNICYYFWDHTVMPGYKASVLKKLKEEIEDEKQETD